MKEDELALWVMESDDQNDQDALRLFVIEAQTEIEAHHKAGIILRKNRHLWFRTLVTWAHGMDTYRSGEVDKENVTVTFYKSEYYQEIWR